MFFEYLTIKFSKVEGSKVDLFGSSASGIEMNNQSGNNCGTCGVGGHIHIADGPGVVPPVIWDLKPSVKHFRHSDLLHIPSCPSLGRKPGYQWTMVVTYAFPSPNHYRALTNQEYQILLVTWMVSL